MTARSTATRRRATALLAVLALTAGACSDSGDSTSPTDASEPAVEPSTTTAAGDPPVNPFLADSVVPIGHFDSAQTDSMTVAGPTGPTATLSPDELTYTHLGPAHFGLAISPTYPDGRRVIWSNGGDRISKLDAETLEVLAELPLPDKEPVTSEMADAHIAELDGLEGRALADAGIGLAAQYLTGLSGVYYLLDRDNTLFVGGAESILAYRDVDPDDPASPIELAATFARPAEVTGSFAGANLTFDGHLVMITDEGWIVVAARDFSSHQAVRLPGGEAAPAHNEQMGAEGRRAGQADWVRNSVAVDDDGGIYALSLDHAHKVVWDGSSLSTDPADGAWTAPYRNGSGNGSGATPSLMGFGPDADRFVVFTDGEDVMNVVLMWRDEIPAGWTPPEGAPSERIAGQVRADIGDPTRTAVQTEQSVVVGGYGALVVNNDPSSIPDGFPPAATRILAGYAGADPDFTPKGLQKLAWDPTADRLDTAWVNREVSSANAVPLVSTGSDTLYTVGARDGAWTLEGLDWSTGESVFHWVTGSNRYNTLFSGLNLDEQGRVMHTTAFGIVRYEPR
ncbi:hypothetical protein [Rhabdothermincola salaria]|uniref:hypothetical protein n=1 Tax=Rhabdothermincola salaria TaxID=2903142 RepID=UPI001E54B84E|nr:hypothetical protein [Rhabdothermincola salaria]MCD9624677.1 hypothetical protein [Rhabdothermincola salaria]